MLRGTRHKHVTEGRCPLHDLAAAVARCGKCDGGYCEACLVYPFGVGRPPYCTHCALVLAGVRRG